MKEALPVDELEAVANVEIGEALRRTRIYYGKTLEDVEKALRIRACQIEAIERGDMEALPGRVYAIGFVRSYGEYLDLDGSKVVQLFKSQYMDGQNKALLSFPVPASETKTPALWLVTLCLITASFFVFTWHSINKPDRSIVQEVVSLPERIEAHVNKDILVSLSSNKSEETTLSLEQDHNIVQEPVVENMGEGEEQKSGVILKMLGDSWVEIKNEDGAILVSKVLVTGDEYFVPDNPNLSMSLGNAANVEIILGGRALKPLGKEGDVRRDIPLNSDYLKTLDFKEEEEKTSLDVQVLE